MCRLIAVAAVLAFAPAFTVSAESQQAAPAAQAGAEPASAGKDDEIIIHGRGMDRFRIPQEMRTLPAGRSGHTATAFDPRLACRNVGPTGCGTELLPIVTIGADGKVRVGSEGAEK